MRSGPLPCLFRVEFLLLPLPVVALQPAFIRISISNSHSSTSRRGGLLCLPLFVVPSVLFINVLNYLH